MSDGPGRFSDQFNLRLPDGMRDRLKVEAEANKRSMNAEIVARLESTLAKSAIHEASFATEVQKAVETSIKNISKKLESLKTEAETYKISRPDLVFSYRDRETGNVYGAVVEFRRSINNLPDAMYQIRKYTVVNETIRLGIIVANQDLYVFDAQTGRRMSLNDVPDAVDRYYQIMKIDLRTVLNKNIKPSDVTGAA